MPRFLSKLNSKSPASFVGHIAKILWLMHVLDLCSFEAYDLAYHIAYNKYLKQ
jgi:hypothetical protein